MKRKKMKQWGAVALCAGMVLTSIPVIPGTAVAAPAAVLAEETRVLPYLDTSLSFEARATDLVSRMTLDEKISQMGNTMAAIPRLGVKRYNLWNEGIHGIWNLNNGCKENTTSFPTSIAISCSWNPELYQKEASMISDEARALTALHGTPLSYWSPTINLSRDPRWGRNDEGYGEDPFLTTKMGGAFVSGMQGDNEDGYLKVISTIKHFAANNSEGNRFNGSADMDDRDKYEYYTRAFKDIAEQYHPGSLMTSYNAINGTPNTVNRDLVTTDLRHKWGFDGYVTSDDTALYFTYASQKWSSAEGIAPSAYDTAQAALKAGVDTACSSGEYKNNCKQLIRDGVITEADVDRAVIRVFTGRMATGEFDEGYGPYGNITGEEIEAQDHLDTALQAAQESIVLLKNDDNTLPLNKADLSGKTVAVIGDFGKRLELGGYSGNPTVKKTFYDGIVDALEGSGATVLYDQGAQASGNDRPYLFNVDWFEMEYSDGKEPLKIEAEAFSSENGGVISEGKNIGYIADGCYTVYKNVNLDKLSKLKVSAAAHRDQAAGGVVELRVNSPTGPVMASAVIGMTSGWQNYQTFEGLPGQLNYDTPQDIYMVYKRNASDNVSDSALELAKTADVVLISLGTSHDNLCKEGKDRSSVALPYFQEPMAVAVAEAAKAADPNKKVIVQMNTVGMVGVEAFKDKVDAMIWSGYNGQSQGTAAADVIFGQVNPSGHLSFSWYEDDSQIPNIYDYHLREGLGRTYMYGTGKVSYPFGYGLSYTDFEYSNMKVDKKNVTPDDRLTVTVDVTNTGNMDGAATVQLYVATPESPEELDRPAKRLNGFEKVFIEKGETKTVSIEVDCSNLYFWDNEKSCQTFDQGNYEIQLGESSADIKLTETVKMEGQPSVVLEHATLDTDKFILKQGETANISLVAAMSDETFADLDETEVRYESSNEAAVTVDENGVATGVGHGVALITATVTKDGKSVEDSIAIESKMSAEPEDILLDGVSMLGFAPDKKDYALTWPADTKLPKVSVQVKEGMTAEVTQPNEETERAEIKISNGEEEFLYTITFSKQSGIISDPFTDDVMNDTWEVIHEDKNHYRYVPGEGMTITVQNGDLFQHLNNAKNLIVQTADGDWTAETKVEFSKSLSNTYQQAGLVAYADDDNYVKLDYEYSDGGARYLQFSKEENQKRTYSNLGTPGELKTVYFRLVKRGNQYSGYYSTDGKNFVQQGDTITFNGDVKVGMIAFGSGTPVDATFKYFNAAAEKAYDLALAEAADAVKRAEYTDVAQKDAPTEEDVKAHVLGTAKEAVNNAEVEVSVDTVAYTPAEEAENGSYTFKVSVTRDGVTVAGEEKTIVIIGRTVTEEPKYQVTIDGELFKEGEYNEKITVTADAEKNGEQFAGWMMDGKIVSTEETYTFYLSGDIRLTTVYAAEAAEVEPGAMLVSRIPLARPDGKMDARFVGQVVLPKGSKLLQAGLVWSSKDTPAELECGADGVKTTSIHTISNTNQFSVTIKGMPSGKFVRGRIYAEVMTADGETRTVYSAEGMIQN